MSQAPHLEIQKFAALAFVPVASLLIAVSAARAQAPNPTSATNPFYGSITVQPASESTLKLSLPALINEAYWILEQRNLAAHENNYKEYTLAIFRQRLYGRNGLLGCLHTDA